MKNEIISSRFCIALSKQPAIDTVIKNPSELVRILMRSISISPQASILGYENENEGRYIHHFIGHSEQMHDLFRKMDEFVEDLKS